MNPVLKKINYQRLVLVGLLSVSLGGLNDAQAVTVGEVESNDSFATAQNLDGLFDLTANANIFNSTTVPHATVLGTNGSTRDVDYYAFSVSMAGSTGYFDIDCGNECGVDMDTVLFLFDDLHNLLGRNDDNELDPGTSSSLDSLFGVYTFANPGDYFIAVSNFGNFTFATGTFIGELVSPAGTFGGEEFAGDSGPTSVNPGDGDHDVGDYILHASLSHPGVNPHTAEVANASVHSAMRRFPTLSIFPTLFPQTFTHNRQSPLSKVKRATFAHC